MPKVWLKCEKEVREFGELKFKEKKMYRAKRIADLIEVKSEAGSLLHISDLPNNEWFLRTFSIVVIKEKKEEKILQRVV